MLRRPAANKENAQRLRAVDKARFTGHLCCRLFAARYAYLQAFSVRLFSPRALPRRAFCQLAFRRASSLLSFPFRQASWRLSFLFREAPSFLFREPGGQRCPV